MTEKRVTWSQFGRMLRDAETAIGRAANLQPLLRECMEILADAHTEFFVNQHSPDGTPWAPLSPVTLKLRKIKKKKKIRSGRKRFGTATQILRDTGRLMQSLASAFPKKDAVRRMTATRLYFGTTVEYAEVHQDFGNRGESNVPERPFLGINAETKERLADAAGEFAMGLVIQAMRL